MWLGIPGRVERLFWGWRMMKGHEIPSAVAAAGSGFRAVVWGGMGYLFSNRNYDNGISKTNSLCARSHGQVARPPRTTLDVLHSSLFFGGNHQLIPLFSPMDRVRLRYITIFVAATAHQFLSSSYVFT